MNRKGTFGENYAAGYLAERGYRIVERNFRTPSGEIDIIAHDATYIVFVEVKARRSQTYGTPREAVDWRKRKRLVEAAGLYLATHKTEYQPRFDVIEILTNDAFTRVLEITHLPNAFEGN